jgi:hypothetical protein
MTYTYKEALVDSERKWKILLKKFVGKKYSDASKYLAKDKRLGKLRANCGLCEYFQRVYNDCFSCRGCPLISLTEGRVTLFECVDEFLACRNAEKMSKKDIKKVLKMIQEAKKLYVGE